MSNLISEGLYASDPLKSSIVDYGCAAEGIIKPIPPVSSNKLDFSKVENSMYLSIIF